MPDTPRIDPAWAWQRYRPSDERPWNLQRVGHLYRRAAFGATHDQLEEGVRRGVDETINALLNPPADTELDTVWATLKESVSASNNGAQLPATWVYRMLYTQQPLVEKMTLFWHNHFATSNLKVQNARYMLGQYELMRRHALGSFSTMLRDISHDPAMLVWLDTILSQRNRPNENYARELMELFSLGIPHPREAGRRNYTEQDIREAARAFTGWRVVGGRDVYQPADHDPSEKTVFGRRGNWGWEQIVNFCLEHEACPYFIAGKLFRFFVSDTLTPTADLLQPIASLLREERFEIRPVVERILRSNLFHSEHSYRAKIKSPVEFTLGIVRALEGQVPDAALPRRIPTSQLARAMEEMGQRLFYPPSVAGWNGGQAWLNGQTFLLRQNLSLALTSTTDDRFGRRTDPAAVAERHGKRNNEDRIDFFLKVFLQGDVAAAQRRQLLDFMEQASRNRYPAFWSPRDAEEQRIRALCHLVLCLPEFQLN